jgi:FlaA1/EpsC-like NDP-sugar epimerase
MAETTPSQGAHIWWGPITSELQAREIIAWTAWSLLLLGAAPAAALALGAAHHEIIVARPFYANLADNWYVLAQAVFMSVELGAAVVLLRFRSWISAVVLLLCCAFVIALLLLTIVHVSSDGSLNPTVVAQYLVLEVCLLFFTHLIWRAMHATQAIRQLKVLDHFS